MADKIVIGRREIIRLPQFGIGSIEAKIDTGAYTSSLHCSVIEEITENGENILLVSLLDESHPEYSNQYHKFHRFEKKMVKSSNGESEERYVIQTIVVIAKKKYKANFSLTNREKMKYPVLLGRRFLKNKFIVDVALIYNTQSSANRA